MPARRSVCNATILHNSANESSRHAPEKEKAIPGLRDADVRRRLSPLRMADKDWQRLAAASPLNKTTVIEAIVADISEAIMKQRKEVADSQAAHREAMREHWPWYI